jgi:hypothetical protein
LLCPLCREQWGSLVGDGPSHGVGCSDCKNLINGELYRCAFCHCYNLCRECFQCPAIHAQHPFDVAFFPGARFQPATRPVRRAPVLQQAQSVASSQEVLNSNVRSLMYRDLGPEDYETLLRLDDYHPPTERLLTLPEVGALPRHTWLGRNEGDLYDTCAICLELFHEGESVVKLRLCDHVFHEPCVTRWLTEFKGQCPVDNTPVFVPARDIAPAAAGLQQPDASNASRRPLQRRNAEPRSGNANRRPSQNRPQQVQVESQRNPNTTISGYCPSASDLAMLFVGIANPLPVGGPTHTTAHRGRFPPRATMSLR